MELGSYINLFKIQAIFIYSRAKTHNLFPCLTLVSSTHLSTKHMNGPSKYEWFFDDRSNRDIFMDCLIFFFACCFFSSFEWIIDIINFNVKMNKIILRCNSVYKCLFVCIILCAHKMKYELVNTRLHSYLIKLPVHRHTCLRLPGVNIDSKSTPHFSCNHAVPNLWRVGQTIISAFIYSCYLIYRCRSD